MFYNNLYIDSNYFSQENLCIISSRHQDKLSGNFYEVLPMEDQARDKFILNYLKKYGVEIDAKKATYSINQGIWGTSVGGKETLTSRYTLPEEAYPTPLKKDCEPKEISITFEQGEITALNDKNKGLEKTFFSSNFRIFSKKLFSFSSLITPYFFK